MTLDPKFLQPEHTSAPSAPEAELQTDKNFCDPEPFDLTRDLLAIANLQYSGIVLL